MMVCNAEAISRHYGPTPIFRDVSLRIEEGERIGLVGPNGAGKSTFVRVLAGIDPPDTGRFQLASGFTVGLLRQFPDFPPDRTLYAEALSAMAHLQAWYDEMVAAGEHLAAAADDEERKRWEKRYDQLQERLHQHGGFDFEYRVEEVLTGLGFVKEQYDRPLGTFSGGQQSRVLLAKLLLQSPDLMLLDEPTNHLDIATTEWLEDYLCRQETAMLIVSHDRYFLDKTVQKVFEIYAGRGTLFPGNYADYLKLRAERQKVAERERTKQEEQIAHYQDFVRKNKSGQLAKQAKAREKMIERVQAELTETIGDVSTPTIDFGSATRTGDLVVTVEELSKRFGDLVLFEDARFDIARGERVGIVGANGTGKTTLLRILLGEEEQSGGHVRIGHNVSIGYLDQELTLLDPNQTPLDAVRPEWRVAEKEEPFRALLAQFGVHAALAEQRLGTLSGGEKTRVALARLRAHEVNVLVLDEPTNHLDLWARESLEQALLAFDGTVLVVSHDRYFLERAVERLLVIENQRVRLIPGSYTRYQEMRKADATESAAKTPTPSDAGKSKASDDVASAPAKRKRKFPFRKTAEIEADITACEERITELEIAMQQPDVYRDGRKMKEVSEELDERRAALEQLMEHWEEALELNPS